MELTVLGNNGPYPAPGGACSGYLLQGGGTRVVLDLGSGALANLMAAIDGDLELIDAIILSHLHADHISDISVLRYALEKALKNSAAGKDGKPRRIPLFCPPAPEREYSALRSYAQFDVFALCDGMEFDIHSLSFAFMPMTHPYPTFAIAAEEGGAALREEDAAARHDEGGVALHVEGRAALREEGGVALHVEGRAARHDEVGVALHVEGIAALREEGGAVRRHAKFVYTGDTSWDPGILLIAEGADTLLADACLLSRDKQPGMPIAHMTADECGIAAAEANAKRLLLTHFTPGSEPARHLAEARAGIQKVCGRMDRIDVEPTRIMATYEI